ncbi:hypothetical protein ATO7_06295 [Oceanococcus atlanticus]|uniref:Uncharacterized protein n=1 Tax=Oceanococcus atlanticus TaxID=1317117 RepID=A0A1Y1SIR2_9GAMM|nr:hypothetical protein ATO7_06295 [Oceanococcus atlanticus]
MIQSYDQHDSGSLNLIRRQRPASKQLQDVVANINVESACDLKYLLRPKAPIDIDVPYFSSTKILQTKLVWC